MLKVLTLQKKRTTAQKKLKQLRAKRKKLREDEQALEEQIEALEEIPAEIEEQIDQLTEQQTQVEDDIAEVLKELDDIQEQLDAIEDTTDDVAEELDVEPTESDDDDGTRRRARRANPQRRDARSLTSASRNFQSRSRCFTSRSQRDAFYARTSVKDFLGRVRSMLGAQTGKRGSRRAVTGAELTIPVDVLDILRDNMDQYSKLITRVRVRPLPGRARQNIIGEVPEGIWMEMAGALKELEFTITEAEMDGFKVGGVIIIDNYMLKDSDINLGEEILYMLGQSIGLALDKAIIFGLGPNSKMPVGIVTRLAQTEQPGYWGANQGEWKDFHSTNIFKLNLANKNGAEFFIPFLQKLRVAKTKYTTGERCWIVNNSTRDDLLIKALGIDAAAAIVAGMQDTMPILGGDIITLEFMPDAMVVGGALGAYTLVEREDGTFGFSDLPLFIQDKTVFKGTARYDGQPLFGEDFVAGTYDNTDVTTEVDFAPFEDDEDEGGDEGGKT